MSIRCPKCGGNWTKATDSRRMQDGAIIRRRKVCMIDDCNHKFTTWEVTEEIYSKLRILDSKAYNFKSLSDAAATIQAFAKAVGAAP